MGADEKRRWTAVKAKHDERLRELSQGAPAPSLAVRAYTTRVLPALQYVAQFAAPPPDCEARRSDVAERLWHAPHKSLPQAAMAPLRAMGAPIPSSIRGALQSALSSSARRHRQAVEEGTALLRAARERFAPIAGLAADRPWADEAMWKCRAICDVLEEAAHQDEGSRRREDESRRRWRKFCRRRTPLPGGVGAPDLAHVEGARALRPRLRRWFLEADASNVELERCAAAALLRCAGVSPCHWVAMVKTWCDGWPTSHRRGLACADCVACGRRRGDIVQHLVLCPALTGAVARVTGIQPPSNRWEALALTESPPAPRRVGPAPRQRLLFLSVQLDAYQKLAGGDRPTPRSRARAAARLRTAVLAAHRRIASR